MGTRAPQSLLLLLLFLPMLPPRGASAGSLHSPGLSECFQVNGADYRGQQNRTGPRGAGRPCLFWDQTQQHSYSSARDPQGRWGLGAHNFCRNPDGDVQPWCYVAETEEGIYWRYCDIPTCHMPGYLGCFVDSGAPPALSGPSGTSTKLTVQVCLRFCRMKGYQLAGVEAGYACFCGSESDLTRGRPAPATDCDQICFGHPGQLCGGDGRLGVYEVSVGSCQGNWTAPQGVIYSPDFPDEYGPDQNCSWALGPPGAALELTFRLFELADPRDRLELRDASSGSLLRAFDGARPPPPGTLRLSAAALLLTFRSDERGHAQGFALTYRGPCREPGDARGLRPDPCSSPRRDQCELQPPAWGSRGRDGGPGLLDSDGHLSAAAAATAAAAAAVAAAPTELSAGSGKRVPGVEAFPGLQEKLGRVVPPSPRGGTALLPRRHPGRESSLELPPPERLQSEFPAFAHLCSLSRDLKGPLDPPSVGWTSVMPHSTMASTF
ncbi:kremen protein 2 isoform X1 [Saccopteryx leptura]|uniref:kremen protein 2 isoform X1 n=1 Tax=Saccopteryx leptura TaxID=249018 RepID=UPI00339CB489